MIDPHLAYEATGTVDDERSATHGPFDETLKIVAGMWSAYLDKWIKEDDVAQMMVMMKIARSRNAYHRDHYLDQVGYTLMAEALRRPWNNDFLDPGEDIAWPELRC